MLSSPNAKLVLGQDFVTRSISDLNLENAGLVFLGYGLEQEDYNDFEGLDLKGKGVVIISDTPKDKKGNELFDKLPSFIRNADINLGTSFLNHDDPDYTFKAGLTWSFGGAKSSRNEVAAQHREDATAIVVEH